MERYEAEDESNRTRGGEGMRKLEEEIREFLIQRGAVKVAFTNTEALKGGPPSADLTYALPEARSAVSFAMPLDRDKIRLCLSKRSHKEFEENNLETNIRVNKVGKELALWLESKGFASKRIVSNNKYRKDCEGWQLKMHPDISHRYVAVASGLGTFGWSGNVLVEGWGAIVILGTVVTQAELEPTPPVPSEQSLCDMCKLCVGACASGMFDNKRETSVTLGGRTYTFAERISYTRCQIVCGGFSGLAKSGKWSTWSPGRYRFHSIENEDELVKELIRAIGNYGKWPRRSDGDGGYKNEAVEGLNIRLTCGNCQLICWGNKEDTRDNYRMLTTSGCVVQKENGEIVVLPPDEAEKLFMSLPAEHRKLYF